MAIDIMFDDLKEEAQQQVLDLYEIESPEEANLDTVPLFVLDAPEGTED